VLIQIEVTAKELEQYATILTISKMMGVGSGLLPLEKLAEKVVQAGRVQVKETEHAQDTA